MAATPTRSSSKTSARRAQILQAAEQLFQHYGFSKTTVADIARAANVGVGTVYLEFSSKETIASELSLQRYQCVLEAMRVAADAKGSFTARLEAIFEARLQWFSQFTDAGPHSKELIRGACMATNKAHEQFLTHEHELLTQFLRAATNAGEFEITDPAMTARVLLRLYHSYSLHLGSNSMPTANELRAAYRMVVHGLLSRH